jgi:hypothetical protein
MEPGAPTTECLSVDRGLATMQANAAGNLGTS